MAAKLITRLVMAFMAAGGVYWGIGGLSPGDSLGASHGNYVYPASIYPPPSSWPKWGPAGGCASRRGVERLSPSAARSAVAAVRHLDGKFANDRRYSDRAYWPVLRETDGFEAGSKQKSRGTTQSRVVSVVPAVKSVYARMVGHWCGREIVRLSESVTVGPGRSAPALDAEYWLVDRRGHWLVWFSNP